jgi:TonB family protein
MRKLTISTRFVFVFALFFTFSIAAFSQIKTNSAPARWEYYSGKDKKVSFLLPRLPVAVNESNYCRGEESIAYGSYTDGAAYVVRITSKIDVPKFCAEKKEFDKTNFENRISFLKNTPLALKERETAKSNEMILEGDRQIYKLINDSKNDRWFELLVVGADEKKKEVQDFLGSLKTGKKTSGIEIGSGAVRTLGDEYTAKIPDSPETQQPENTSKISGTQGVRIVLKPRANYTDMARRNETQGKVVLRVTFTANGGIGAISVVAGLPDGLTEQAIAAAQRLLFIPAQRNGARYSVTKPVEYTFSIY